MILHRYLTKEIIKTQVAILFILLLLFFCQQLVKVLSSAVNGKIPSDLVLSLLGLGMPAMAQLMLPLSLFIALLLTLGKLYAESEITVMYACGAKKTILIHLVLFLSFVTAALATINTLWLAPWAMQKQVHVLDEAKANPSLSVLLPGQFISSNHGEFVLFINKVKDKTIHDVYLFQTKERGNMKPSVVVAEKGEITSLANGDQILNLYNSQRIEGSAVLPDFILTHFENYQAYINYKEKHTVIDDIGRASLTTLINNPSSATYAELLWRLSLIFAVPIMAMMAIPLSKVNPRQGRFAKMLPALMLYLIYFLTLSSLKSAGVNEKLDTSFYMIAVNLFFLCLSVLLNQWDSPSFYAFRQRLQLNKKVMP